MSWISSPGPEVVCTDVSLSFGNLLVLRTVNFTAVPGEIHCLIGPNGGGKSCLIQSILGQMRHTGSISIAWSDADRTIGYVPQQINLDKTIPMTVQDFIALCIQKQPACFGVHKTIQKEVDHILADVNMQNRKKALFSDLSGGERQRVLFAQALLPKPRLLILDEPMNSIDKAGATIFSEIIKKLTDDKVTVIWVHHDLAEVRAIADTVTCLNREVLFSGRPDEVMDESHLLEIFAASRFV